jgi:hypothetical protein
MARFDRAIARDIVSMLMARSGRAKTAEFGNPFADWNNSRGEKQRLPVSELYDKPPAGSPCL